MLQATPVSTIAQLIQLAIAPVLLLAGIGAILNVLAQRLARIVDRARVLEAEYASLDDGERCRAATELEILDRRMSVVNRAISVCTASALFVCLVISILFVADLAQIEWGRPIAVLFILAMLLLTAGLLFFLYEIRLAARSLRVRQEFMPHRRKGKR
jgi:type IV secretory pathway VirB6-like protein